MAPPVSSRILTSCCCIRSTKPWPMPMKLFPSVLTSVWSWWTSFNPHWRWTSQIVLLPLLLLTVSSQQAEGLFIGHRLPRAVRLLHSRILHSEHSQCMLILAFLETGHRRMTVLLRPRTLFMKCTPSARRCSAPRATLVPRLPPPFSWRNALSICLKRPSPSGLCLWSVSYTLRKKPLSRSRQPLRFCTRWPLFVPVAVDSLRRTQKDWRGWLSLRELLLEWFSIRAISLPILLTMVWVLCPSQTP